MLIWNVLKRAALDFWDEILYLMIFNMIWFLGSLLIIPLPFLTFGLWHTAYDISRSKGINFGVFFNHLRRTWPAALGWGGVNLGLAIIVVINLNFYAGFETPWATIARLIVMALALLWSVVQVVALAVYPRLESPGFRLATRNAAVVMAKYPLPVLALMAMLVLLGVATFLFPVLLVLGTVSLLALLTNRLVGAVISRELGQDEGRQEFDA
ncbi:MAG: hypothetical protein AB1801_11030 [Chloroflexota bacterium]